jgi:hypothetical protein
LTRSLFAGSHSDERTVQTANWAAMDNQLKTDLDRIADRLQTLQVRL